MLNLEFGQIKKLKKDVNKRRNSEDSMNSFSQSLNSFIQIPIANKKGGIDRQDKTLIVNKIEWNKEMLEKIDDAFSSPDNYLKDVQGLIISKKMHGPKYTDEFNKEVVPSSIVGNVNQFNLNKNEKKRGGPKSSAASKRKKQSSNNLSLSHKYSAVLDQKGQRNNSRLKSQIDNLSTIGKSNLGKFPVEDEAVIKLYKKIKERINRHTHETAGSLISLPEKLNLSADSSFEDDLASCMSFSKKKKNNFPKSTAKNIQTSNSILNSSAQASKDALAKEENMKGFHNRCKLKLSINRPEDPEFIKVLRKSLEKKHQDFISKIYKNRMELNSYNNYIPIDSQIEMNQQTLVFKRELENEEKSSQLIKNLSRVTKRTPENLLINQVDEYKWNSSINKMNESNKPITEKLREFQWMAMLRRPDNFKGERKCYFNSGNDLWYTYREKEPHSGELVIPPITSKRLKEGSTTLNTYCKNYQSNIQTTINPIPIESEKSDMRRDGITISQKVDISENTTKFTNLHNIKIQEDNKESKFNASRNTMVDLSLISIAKIVNTDRPKLRDIDQALPISNMNINGYSLIDLELANFKLLRGRKLLYTQGINPLTAKEFIPDERKEEVYAFNYDIKQKCPFKISHSQSNVFSKNHELPPIMGVGGGTLYKSNSQATVFDNKANVVWN